MWSRCETMERRVARCVLLCRVIKPSSYSPLESEFPLAVILDIFIVVTGKMSMPVIIEEDHEIVIFLAILKVSTAFALTDSRSLSVFQTQQPLVLTDYHL